MELDFFCLSMRIPLPPPVFRVVLTPLYPVHSSCVILSKNCRKISRSSLLSVRFRSSSCAALDVVTKQPLTGSASDHVERPEFRLHGGFQVTPARLPENNGKSTTRRKFDRLGNGQIGCVDRKERLKWYSEMLRNSTLNLSSKEGKAIHGHLVKKGIDPDMHLWVSLINFYAKCGDLNFARQVLDEMPERDVVSWTALISGFVAEGYGSDGVYLFGEMRKEGIRPNEFALATSLKAGTLCLNVEFGKQVHAEVIKLGTFSDIYVGCALVDLYAKCSEMEYADKVFCCMPEQNVVSWNALLNGYAHMGDGEEVLKLFCKMTESKMKFSKFTLSTVLKGCANSGDLGAGRVVHAMAIKIGCEFDEFVSSNLVDMYSKCGLVDEALKIFTRMRDPDIVAWTAMISCLDQQGQKPEAAKLFGLMRNFGVSPNQFTLSSLVSAATDLDQRYCESIHACVYKYGFESDSSVSNALITMYMKIGNVHKGFHIFDALGSRDIISWNALLSGFHDDETCDQGLQIFKQMLVEGFKPNMYTFISILRCCSSLRNVNFGKQVHAHIIKEMFDENAFIGTALIDVYTKCRFLEDAQVKFNKLNERDLFTWTTIISGYAQTDQGEKAIQCFSQMQKDGVKPNEFTLASCLRGCAGTTSLENGRQLHSLAIKAGRSSDTFVASAIVDMYGKCGCIEDAETFFNGLNSRDTVAWNTIIFGYSQHGHGDKALEAFNIMLEEGFVPDGVTFLGILSACSHMGLIEEGKKLFNSMTEVYGIVPSIEHYACMIDILGRAGKFYELESFIQQMKLTPNALIWETVLGACYIHGNEEFGERAANELFKLEPRIHSNYILLSNIFAAKGSWVDVARVRALMSSQGVKKEPACSWVEVDTQFHVFLSQDGSHPKIHEIHQKLEELGQKLTSVGYIPKTRYVLHNVTDREKVGNLLYHSERLALGFALISSTSSKTIRIFKNLRICGDCHDFMKIVSEFINQEIIIRDIKRFHHFRNGTCSCQDYW
ncbi:pentatricopeptide repeat-containing protein At3g24000, mitochondrial-like [Diospyros lotus]|uniref:pentatricopeptide repeat-containing protein At3g24000, mitochondrial-like n=1 Tax=Diospyros lotus TaxID=55363 RepID=UPI00224CE313|nr:pentatricopeptide repeat-containing protein At3g24000, mitochondrial-like [Diospyros lotus]